MSVKLDEAYLCKGRLKIVHVNLRLLVPLREGLDPLFDVWKVAVPEYERVTSDYEKICFATRISSRTQYRKALPYLIQSISGREEFVDVGPAGIPLCQGSRRDVCEATIKNMTRT